MSLAQKILAICIAIGLPTSHAIAADSKKEARVTQIIRDVKLLPKDAAARAAVVNDRVAEDTGVRTGGDSRSELTFADLTITRLGANTIFSFNKAGRNVQLESGSILLRVPKNSGGGAINTSAVTAAVTGSTVIFESTRAGKSKLIVLEGGARASLVKHLGQSQYVRAGQMLEVPAGATTLPSPSDVDLNEIMRKHPLITDFPPLPSRDLILAVRQQQHPPGPPPGPQWYADNEWNGSLWGTYASTGNKEALTPGRFLAGKNDTYLEADHAWGGGIDAKYFFSRYFGLGVEGYVLDVRQSYPNVFIPFPQLGFNQAFAATAHDRRAVGSVLATFTLRYPIGCSRFAPYVFAGGGVIFGGGQRITPSSTVLPNGSVSLRSDSSAEAVRQFGGGIEVRLTPHIGIINDFSWNLVDGPHNDFGMARTGINFAF
jgi:FecR-like protein